MQVGDKELKGGEGLREEETAGTCASSVSFRVPAWALTKRVTYCKDLGLHSLLGNDSDSDSDKDVLLCGLGKRLLLLVDSDVAVGVLFPY